MSQSNPRPKASRISHERFVGSWHYCQAKIYRLNRQDYWISESKPPRFGLYDRYKERMYRWSDGSYISDYDLQRSGRWEVHMEKVIDG